MVDFKAKIKDVPDNPGVYMMLDDRGEIIYVGKAKNLKNRLRSYFFNLSGRPKKCPLCSNTWRIFVILFAQAKWMLCSRKTTL